MTIIESVLRKTVKFIFRFIAIAILAVTAGILIPRPLWQGAAGSGERSHRILVLSNPIHTDIAIPVEPKVLQRFGFLRDAGLPIDNPGVRTIVFGWGGRSFYTETPTWADLKPMPVLKSLTVDRAVMHVSITGDIPSAAPDVMPVAISDDGFGHLLDFIAQSFTGADKPVSLGLSYGSNDAFFEAEGSFNALFGCNTWTAAGLRSAGVATGFWTPLPPFLRWSLRLHGGAAVGDR